MAELIRDLEPSMSITEAAEIGNVGHKVIRRKIREGTLPAVKVGGRWRIRPEHVAEMLGVTA